ncbi:uncharacterized protein [Spinacia oleracea]|uniref:Reverse transcriptase domain-containing protein n=1 Tax=Spinacia oleracea TaxID=3562 RepID=A0ABM3RIK9_SPIOL|nr:uncharacterized protein LOC130469937 [Spinacia oleracea]
MGPWKSPGPDGIPAGFYQRNWEWVKQDVIKAVSSTLHSGNILREFNMTNIALIPKCENPDSVTKYRPISLCNVIYKIVSKCITNRLRMVIGDLVGPYQNAFIPGRAISDNILLAHEVLEHIRKSKKGRNAKIAIKADMSKAYDRIKWDFLEKVLIKMKLPTCLIKIIMNCVTSVSYAILLNGQQQEIIKPQCGLRQGDPLSPYLFILCMEGLSGLIISEEKEGRLKGVKVARNAPPISHLFFADDSFFFLQGLPADFKSNKKTIFQTLIDKVQERLNAWNSLFLSPAGRWDVITKHKKEGGLGIKDPKKFNKALLAKKGWKIINDTNSLLSKTFSAKYKINKESLFKDKWNKEGQASWGWRGVKWGLELVREGSYWAIGDGCLAKCDHPWVLGERPVWKPSINNQIRKEDMVRSLINEDTNEWDNLKLEQNFSTNTITKILSIEIMERGSQDDLVWKKEKMGYYTVRSGYSMQLDAQKAQMNGCIQRNWSHLWKANMNNKWKVFLWKLLNNSLPVGKEFIKRKIVVDSMCRFCETNVESLEHLFRDCNMSKHIWAAGRLGLRTDLQSNVPLGDWVWNWFKMLRERKEEDSHRFNYFTATLWAIWCARNEITFNKGSCSAKGILDRVENTFSIEMQGRTRNKENETRKRNDDPEEPPGFERKKKLEEPPGFERNILNKDGTSYHLIGKGNNCVKRVIHTHVNTSASVISANVNSIPLLNGTNFKDWKENISIVLGCMDLDLALRTDKPAALTAESTADQERDFERWDRSNRMCVMIMKRGIPESFRGSVSDEVKRT